MAHVVDFGEGINSASHTTVSPFISFVNDILEQCGEDWNGIETRDERWRMTDHTYSFVCAPCSRAY